MGRPRSLFEYCDKNINSQYAAIVALTHWMLGIFSTWCFSKLMFSNILSDWHRVFYGVESWREFWSGVLEWSQIWSGKSRMECSYDLCVCYCLITISRLHKTWPHTHISQLHSILLWPLQNLTPFQYSAPGLHFIEYTILWAKNKYFCHSKIWLLSTPILHSKTPFKDSTP